MIDRVKWLIFVFILGGIMLLTKTASSHLSQSERPSILSETLVMGPTELWVQDLEKMKNYYSQLVGLEVISEAENQVTLGSSNRPVLKLIQDSSLDAAQFGQAGLYHNAILFDSRATLAQTLDKILTEQYSSFIGSSDHLVSEAFYFIDPEGNGLELYFDKDPSTWQWQNGRIVMGSQYIDPENYLEEYGKASAPTDRKMGHVHLKVGDIEQAKTFYVEILGLKITAETPGALFVSDGKYHHHLGLNVWESNGAGTREESLGLKSLEIQVSQAEDIEHLTNRLTTQQVNFERDDQGLTVYDPWKNQIRVRRKK